MANFKFKIGDKVQLKTGGPIMMVESNQVLTRTEGRPIYVDCVWFDEAKSNEAIRDSFDQELLIKID